jgi:hypothetical protein
MLTRLSIFIFLFVLAQRALPMQGGQQGVQTQSHQEETTSNAPVNCASEICKEDAAKAERNAYYKAHHEEYFWAAFGPENLSNWVLAGVGGIGIIVALCTLFAVSSQSDQMRRQNEIVVSRERPRIAIELKKIDVVKVYESEYKRVHALVTISGATDAFVNLTQFYCCIGEDDGYKKPKLIPSFTQLSSIIKSMSEPIECSAIVMSGLKVHLDAAEVERVRAEELYFYALAMIRYSDVFGEDRVYEIHRRFRVMKTTEDSWIDGYWEEYDPNLPNGERKVEPAKWWQRRSS